EELVLQHRSAHGETKLVASKGAFCCTLLVVEFGIRGVRGKPVVLPRIAVEGTAARLGGYADDAARGAAKLRLIVAGGDAEFLNAIQWHIDADSIAEDADILDTVERNFRACRALAVDVESNTARGGVLSIRTAAGGTARRACIAVGDVAGDGDKVIGIAGEAGQRRELLSA